MKEKTHRYSAVEVRYPVTVLTAEGHLQGETLLISNRGALIRCQQPPNLYERATISIDISERETLIAEAEVARLELYESDDHHEIAPRGMVVRFTRLSRVGRQQLRSVIAKHYAKKVNRMTPEN